MSDEKKDEVKGGASANPTAAQSAQNADAPNPEGAKAAGTDAEPAKAAVKKEKPANCATCNKSIKKKQMYYRNGKHYCSKRCWKTTLKKEGPQEGQEAPK